MNRMILVAAVLVPLATSGAPRPAPGADAGVSLRIGDRYDGTRLRFTTRPRMRIVPGSRVYYIRDSDQDVYHYGRFYYGYDQGRWYRASTYRGPWIYVHGRTVPRQIYSVPSDYRRNWEGDYNYWRARDYDDGWQRYEGNGVDRGGTMAPAGANRTGASGSGPRGTQSGGSRRGY